MTVWGVLGELGSAGRWPAGGLVWYLRATGGLRAFARAAGGLEWYLRAISGLRAFAGRRPALLVERLEVVLRPIAPGADLLWIGSGLFGRR